MKILGPNMEFIDLIKKQLAISYKMTDLGLSAMYLGMEISRDWTNKTITVTQTKHINKVLKAHGMEDCKYVSTPMETGIALVKAGEGYTATQEDVTAYSLSLGSLMHIMLHSRPDIAFSVSKLSQYSSNLTDQHWKALKQVIRYLAGTKDQGINYLWNRETGTQIVRLDRLKIGLEILMIADQLLAICSF